MISSAQRNQVESPLLRLPREIRREIFEYVLGGEILLLHIALWEDEPTKVYRKDRGPNKLSSLEVCHQLYYELKLLPFKLSIFEDDFEHWNCQCMCQWLGERLAPEQRDAIKTIRIRVDFLPHEKLIDRYSMFELSIPSRLMFRGLTHVYLDGAIMASAPLDEPKRWHKCRHLFEWADRLVEQVKDSFGEEVVVQYEVNEERTSREPNETPWRTFHSPEYWARLEEEKLSELIRGLRPGDQDYWDRRASEWLLYGEDD